MGLFGSSSKTYYNSTSTVLYDTMPGLVQQTLASSVTQNRNIASDLIGNLVNGIFYQAKRLRNYGLSGNYPWGLPDVSASFLHPQSVDYVTQVLRDIEGEPVIVTYVYLDVDTDTSSVLYRAEYYYLDNTGEPEGDVQYWTYDESTGQYPLLDLDVEDLIGESPYYPIIPLRIDNVDLVDESQPDWLAITQACRFINVDARDLADSMLEQFEETGENPVEDAFIMIGVEVNAQDQASKEFLFRNFDYEYSRGHLTQRDYDYWENSSQVGTPPMNRIQLSDSNYKMEIGWSYILREEITGTLSAPYETEYASAPPIFIQGGITSVARDSLILRKRITPTTYVELQVVGLVHSNWAVGKELRTTLYDAFDDPDLTSSFIIPLRQDITQPMGSIKQHDLMYKSIRLLLNDRFRQKLRWYETGFFQVFTLIVAIVVSVFYPPAWAIAGGLSTAAIIGVTMIQYVAARVLTPVIAKALENVLGAQFAQLVAVLAVSYGSAAAVNGGLTGAAASLSSSLTAGLQNLTSFQGALSLGLQVGNTLMNQSYADRLASISSEIERIEDEYAELMETETEVATQASMVQSAISGDPYNLMAPLNHVSNFQLLTQGPTLIRDNTQYFVDIMKYTDRPDSYIRLGQEL